MYSPGLQVGPRGRGAHGLGEGVIEHILLEEGPQIHGVVLGRGHNGHRGRLRHLHTADTLSVREVRQWLVIRVSYVGGGISLTQGKNMLIRVSRNYSIQDKHCR